MTQELHMKHTSNQPTKLLQTKKILKTLTLNKLQVFMTQLLIKLQHLETKQLLQELTKLEMKFQQVETLEVGN
jgi:hypothetical protein